MNFSETKTEIFQADEKTKLLSHIWLPDSEIKGIFLAIHGGMAHAGDWVTPALYFKEKGIATYALDLRWHGTYPQYNPGSKIFFHIDSYDVYSKDIHKYYDEIRQQYPTTPVFILSHSNGALIALNYCLGLGKNIDIQGHVMSSPWLENNVKVPKILLALSKVIALVAPKFAIATEEITDKLTHDDTIKKRHYEDEKKGLRGKTASTKIAVESLKTQAFVINNLDQWKTFPIFAVIAGQDLIAVPEAAENALKKVPQDLLHLIIYEDNYHENFNEINREEIFEKIHNWMETEINK